MQITWTTSTKYYLLSLLLALMVAVGVLTVSPSAQAQVVEPPQPTIDKECTPNPVQVGQTLTCTIDVLPAPDTLVAVRVEDTLPDGLTVIGATSEIQPGGDSVPCTVAGNTVTCPPAPQTRFIQNDPVTGFSSIFRVTIEARAERCGTFQNTATATGTVFFVSMPGSAPLSESDTEQITVEGCEVPPAPGQPQGGGAAPITQEGEQESEAGEIDQSFDVS